MDKNKVTHTSSFTNNNWFKILIVAAFPLMCVTAIANLLQTAQKENDSRLMFHKDKDIIPFIEYHWESMTTMPRRVTLSWHDTVRISLIKIHTTTFQFFLDSDISSFAQRCWIFVHNRRKQRWAIFWTD